MYRRAFCSPMQSTGYHGWLEIGEVAGDAGGTRLTLGVTRQQHVDQALVEGAEQRLVVDVNDELVAGDPGAIDLDVDHDPEPLVEQGAESEMAVDQVGIRRREHLVDVEVERERPRRSTHPEILGFAAHRQRGTQ